MSPAFRDEMQQQAVCDRILRLAHLNLHTQALEDLSLGDPDRVRRARTLYDLALALWDGDSQVVLGHLLDLDGDTRGVIGDLLSDMGMANPEQVDRWLESTSAMLERPAGP